jgi:hypothetical protein
MARGLERRPRGFQNQSLKFFGMSSLRVSSAQSFKVFSAHGLA